jgi:hypothetical protein
MKVTFIIHLVYGIGNKTFYDSVYRKIKTNIYDLAHSLFCCTNENMYESFPGYYKHLNSNILKSNCFFSQCHRYCLSSSEMYVCQKLKKTVHKSIIVLPDCAMPLFLFNWFHTCNIARYKCIFPKYNRFEGYYLGY